MNRPFFPGTELMKLLALAAPAGLVVGLRLALEEVVLQGYWSLGFERTVFLTFRDSVSEAVVAAASLGLVLALLRTYVRLASLWPVSPGWGRGRGGPAGFHLWLAGLALLAWVAMPNGTVSATMGLALLWLLMWLILRWISLRRKFSMPQRRSLLAGTGAALLVLFFGGAGGGAAEEVAAEMVFFSLMRATAALLVFEIVRRQVKSWETNSVRDLKKGWPFLGTAVLVVAAWVVDPYLSQPTLQVDNPRNVILIGIDTLRLDHTSLSRQDRRGQELTPNLAMLAESGANFSQATSQAPWTMPAFASILTGRYPHEHAALSLYGLLRKRELTLAEILRESGYFTGAAASHIYVDRKHGFAQGFERFDESNVRGNWAITSEGVTDTALRLLDQRSDRPFFLFVHYFDPHYDYRDHEDWNFTEGYQGWLKPRHLSISNLRLSRHFLGPEDVDYLTDLYDEEIAFTDRQIGRLLSGLRSRNLDQDTAVIVVSDHGEEFMERGWLGHTISLHEEVIRVPLIVKLPGQTRAGTNVVQPVETRAIFATVLEYLGLPRRGQLHGPSLLPLLSTPRAELEERQGVAYSSVWLPDAEPETGKRVMMSSLRVGDWKLIRDLTHERVSLFNLRSDPLETRNLASESSEKRLELSLQLETWMKRMVAEPGKTPTQDLKRDEIRMLKALGYL